jgi:stage II sporulation protein D
VVRRALVAAAALALACCGGASAVLLGRPGGAVDTTSTVTTVLPATTPATTTSTAPTTLVVTGHGWGHGLGMSQWGAYGYAKHGWTYDRILAHYYTGTTLGQAPISSVRVLLADGAKKVTLSATKAWTATDEAGQKWPLEPGKLTLKPALQVVSGGVPIPLGSFATFTGGVSVNGKAYRGTIRVLSLAGKLRVVDVVGLEAYLKGVVPSEMPSGWLPEALKAQAVAARSYAVATSGKTGDFDLYSDVRSQVYGGIAAESAAASAAVDATAGKVVLYAGKVATTYFCSSSGGRTVSALEATGRAVPYLVSVADPYDDASPYHNWGPVLVDARKVAKQLKLTAPLADLKTTLGPSSHVQNVVAVDANGGETTITGPAARTALDVRSTWFSIAWLSLAPPAVPVTYGGATSLAGAARGLAGVTVEAKPTGGSWQPAQPVAPAAAGAFAFVVRPQVTTQYRLVAGLVHAAQVTVQVAPLVRADIQPGTATGSIAPPVAGAPVQLQVQADAQSPWQTVVAGTTDAAGAFALTAPQPWTGTARVRAAPGHGLVAGFSAPVCCR